MIKNMQKTLACLVVATALTALPTKAFALWCETPPAGTGAMIMTATADTLNLNNYIMQEENYADELIGHTATYEVMSRLQEFDFNFRNWMTDWWGNRLLPAMMDLTKQLSADQISQIRHLGAVLDAARQDKTRQEMQKKKISGKKKYQPSEPFIQMDSMGPGTQKSSNLGRALARGFALDDSPRRGNKKGGVSATGRGGEIKSQWEEYVRKFCDPEKGDQGCTVAGTKPGYNRDLPMMLWGDRQTIDLTIPDNRLAVTAALRTLIYPASPNPIPPSAVESVAGRQALLARRSEETRVNTIYHTLGIMVGERVGGGSGVNTQPFAVAIGTPTADNSPDASYSELRRSIARDRYLDPMYVARLITSPQSVVKEMGATGAVRLQAMSDLYKRSEEMMLMEAATYARDLDHEMPGSATAATPLRR